MEMWQSGLLHCLGKAASQVTPGSVSSNLTISAKKIPAVAQGEQGAL